MVLRYLMVSTHPPTRCGIGTYGEQHVALLRSQGHVVDVVSPDGQGNVDFLMDLRGGTKLLQLFKLLPYYDRVSIQYHWAFFYNDPFNRKRRWETLTTTLCFVLLFLRFRNLEIVAHEIPYIPGKQGWLYKWKWKVAPRVVFHTPKERQRFEEHYQMPLPESRVEFRRHDDVYQKFAEHDQTLARRQLGLPIDKLVFLCIGFVQRHKGFHRAMEAFAKTGLRDAELFVVGSPRVMDAENRRYFAELQGLAAKHPNIRMLGSFVSDQDFDTWIIASDCVVLPYLEIWSSAVLGRAQLLGRPAIVSAVGGLPDQACEQDTLFHTDEDLIATFQIVAAKFTQKSVAAE